MDVLSEEGSPLLTWVWESPGCGAACALRSTWSGSPCANPVSWVLLPAHLQHGKPLSSSERTSSPRSLSKAVPGLTQHIHMASNRDFSEVLGNSLSSDLCPQVSIIIRVPGIEGQSLGTSCCGVRRQSVAACRTMLTEEPRPPTSCVMISLEQVTQWRFSVAKCISLSTF